MLAAKSDTLDMVDSHQHFWQILRGDYHWLTADLEQLYHDFLPSHLAPLLREYNVNQTVLIQAAESEAETLFLLNLAEQTEYVGGVVGWIDMTAPDALARLLAFSASPYFKGIRPMLQDIADIKWILNDAFNPLFECMVAKQLTFDALIKEPHLVIIDVLAKRHPDLKIVINHCAKPMLAHPPSPLWLSGMEAVAKRKNVFIKFSGLLTQAPQGVVSVSQLQPYFNHLLNNFGANRIMWGSDWPVVELNGNYGNWVSLTHALFAHLPSQMQHKICKANAIKFYNLVQG